MLDDSDKLAMGARKHWSAAYTQHWIDNPACAVCTDPSEPPHHVRTRGAGGTDDAVNLLNLCAVHHRQIHDAGVTTFMARYPALRARITRALGTPKKPCQG